MLSLKEPFMKFLKLICLLIVSPVVLAQFVKPVIPAANQMKCFKKTCKLAGRYACRDSSDERKMFDACSRQQDINCLNGSLKALSSFEADDVYELSRIAKSCQYVDSQAVKESKKYLSSFEYDDLNEVTQINDAHWLSSKDCLNDTYSLIRTFGLDKHEIILLARGCGGTYAKGCLKDLCEVRGRYACDEVDEITSAMKYCVYAPTPQQRREL